MEIILCLLASRIGLASRALSLAVLCASAISASTIVVDMSFTGSGSVNGVDFTDQTVTLIATGNTASVTESAGVFNLIPTTFTIEVSGFGTGTYTVNPETAIYSNEAANVAGFELLFDYLNFDSSAFSTWNLQTSIGPVSGLDPDLTNGDIFGSTGVETSIGLIEVTSAESGSGSISATINASAVPEPRETTILLGLAGAVLVASRRRKV